MSMAWNFELIRSWNSQSAFVLLIVVRLMNIENNTNFHIIFRDEISTFPTIESLKQ